MKKLSKNIWVKKVFDQSFGLKKKIDQKKKYFLVKIFFAQKKISGQNIFCSKKFSSQKNFWVKKISGQKIFWVKKWLGQKISGQKNFSGQKKNFESKKFLDPKNFGSKNYWIKINTIPWRLAGGQLDYTNLAFKLNFLPHGDSACYKSVSSMFHACYKSVMFTKILQGFWRVVCLHSSHPKHEVGFF